MNEPSMIWLCIIWLPILEYVMLRNDTQFKKNIAVGVTLPFAGRKHPDILARLEQFKKQELLTCIGLIAIAIPCMFIKNFSVSFSLWAVWLLCTTGIPYIPYILCNRDLKRMKAKNGWKQQNNSASVDLSAIPEYHWVSAWAFLPAVALALLPALWDKALLILYAVNAVCIALFWLGYRYLYRRKAERVDDNADLTVALSRMRQCYWGKMWLLCAYFMAAVSWISVLSKGSSVLTGTTVFIVSAALVITCLAIEFRVRRVQETLTADSGKGYYVDDDDFWPGGIVYYNPNDNRLIINNRIGTNSTFNLAHPAGKAVAVLIALLMLSMPFWSLFMDLSGNPTLELSDTTLNISDKYTVECDAIEQITLLEELPDGLTRIMGTGLPDYISGRFAATGYDTLYVCLDPTAPPYLLIETADKTYLAAAADKAVTQEIYEILN